MSKPHAGQKKRRGLSVRVAHDGRLGYSMDSYFVRPSPPTYTGGKVRLDGASASTEEDDSAVVVPGPSEQFGRSLAVVIGINTYGEGIEHLSSAVPDAQAIAEALRRDHLFETWCLFDDEAQLPQLLALLHSRLPSALGPGDRLLLYFAGHGIALDSDAGPAGYLIPAGARRSFRDGFLPMRVVHAALAQLSVRHVFVILDCCFAGAFRWGQTRDVVGASQDGAKVYCEIYDRYLESPAWQVLASASSNQRAFDILANDRDEGTRVHSPFAHALLAGLEGAADYTKDNVITADELAIYVRECVAPAAAQVGARQIPQLFLLEGHDGGQFLFQVPKRSLKLAPAPPVNENTNPYRGLDSFREEDRALFFGRDELTERLVRVVQARRLTVVVGPSGSGKSSLVQAALIPRLRSKGWAVMPTQRPGREPLAVLGTWTRALGAVASESELVASWLTAVSEQTRDRPESPWIVVVDQFEELLTHRTDERERSDFLGGLASALVAAPRLHIVVTVRSDAEPQFHDTVLAQWWPTGRFLVPAMSRSDLRQAIERPARTAVLYFEPSGLVDQLLDDVALVPAPLPLLSFALSELYRCCSARWKRGVRDRALHEADYTAMGSVARALTQRATSVHDQLVVEDASYATTIRNLFMRMVSVAGGEVARRRALRDELEYEDFSENLRVAEVLQRFHEARLISLGHGRDCDSGSGSYAEPTHDELVRGWVKVSQWLDLVDAGVGLGVLLSLGDALRTWSDHSESDSYLWNDPRLEVVHQRAQAQPFMLNANEARFVKRSMSQRRRRRTRLIAGLAAAIVLLAVIAAFAVGEQQRATTEASRAESERESAVHRSEELTLSQARTLVDLNPTKTIAMIKPLATKYRHEVRALAAAARATGVAWSARASRVTRSLEMSGDGLRALSAGADGVIRIHDLVKRTTQPFVDLQVSVSARFADEERQIVTWHDDRLAVFDVKSGARRDITAPAPILDLEVVGITAYWIDANHALWQLDLAGVVPMQIALDEPASSLAPSPDGRWIALAGEDHLFLYDRTRPSEPQPQIMLGKTLEISWAADSKYFAALVDPFFIDVSLNPEPQIMHRQRVGTRLFVAHGGSRMYTIGSTGITMMSRTDDSIDPSTRKQLAGTAVGIVASRGDTMVAGATGGLTVMSPDGDHVLWLQSARIQHVVASPRSPYVIAQLEGRLLVWNLDDIQPRRLLDQPSGRALFATSNLIVVGGTPDLPAQAIDATTGAARPLGAWPGLRAVSATRNGQVFAVIDSARTLHLVSPGHEPEEFPGEVDFAGFATDDRLVIATLAGEIDVYDVPQRRRTLLVTARARLAGMAWGRDQHPWIAAAFVDGTLWRKNLVTGASATIARRPALDPAHLALADGKLLVGADGTVTFLHDREVHAWTAAGQLVRLATAPNPLDDLGEAGAQTVVAFASDSTIYTIGRQPPYPLVDALPAVDGTSGAMSPETGLLVVLENGAISVIDLLVHQRWTLARPDGVTFDNLAISPDGRRVLAQTEKALVTWSIGLPDAADATAAWLDAMTNAVDDRSPGGLGWREQ